MDYINFGREFIFNKVKMVGNENPVVWFSLVGRAGVGKTPSIRRILYPLIKENNKEIKKLY